MNNFLSPIYKILAVHLVSSWLLFSSSANALDLQCELSENSQIEPAVIATMIEAANNGYLYRVDTDASNVSFQVNHFPFSTIEGIFYEFQGGMSMPVETEQPRQALFVIKVNSMVTGDQELDDYLKSPVFFNATQFPEIIFVSTGFEWINESTARLVGELTLHGKTRPLVFNVIIDTSENYSVNQSLKMTLIASAEIQRSEFDMHEMSIFVSDTVRLNLKIEATRVGS